MDRMGPSINYLTTYREVGWGWDGGGVVKPLIYFFCVYMQKGGGVF